MVGFTWIYSDLVGFGGLVNPGLGTVMAFIDEVLPEGGGPSRDVWVLGHKIPWLKVGFLRSCAVMRLASPVQRGHGPLVTAMLGAVHEPPRVFQ